MSIRCEHGMFAKLLQELEARRAQLGGSPHYPSALPVLRGKLTRRELQSYTDYEYVVSAAVPAGPSASTLYRQFLFAGTYISKC